MSWLHPAWYVCQGPQEPPSSMIHWEDSQDVAYSHTHSYDLVHPKQSLQKNYMGQNP